jgi:hypothetical protein
MTLKAKPDPRSDLYYGRWRWCTDFRLDNVWMARSMDLEKFAEELAYRNRWGRHTIDSDAKQILTDWITFMEPWRGQYRQIISYNYAYIYTNTWDLVEAIREFEPIRFCRTREALVVRPKNTIVLQEPQNRLRTYMRDCRIKPDQIPVLRDYLRSQPWKIGPGFQKMLDRDQTFYWSRRYYYVDHDADQDLFFLNMIVPGIIGRTLPIAAR